MKSQFPKKFLSLRDKNGSHRRSKSQEKDEKHRSRPSSDAFWNLFKTDAAKEAARQEQEKEKEASKIEDMTRLLAEKSMTDVTTDHMRLSLHTRFADGDVQKAVEFVELQQKSMVGEIMPFNPEVTMVGAENRGNVTCYLDALLFAMFCYLDTFEVMLKQTSLEDEPRRKLVTLLRLWVNMLRTGKLIHTDLTQLIQDTLAECGWKDARLLEQQDTSEAFAFITETLQLPLLTLQVDLFHQGKTDTDDHKVVYERLLNLAVPEDPENKGVKLEDCLEDYFNTKVDVLRDSHEDKKTTFADPTKQTIRLVTADQTEDSAELSGSPLPLTPSDKPWPTVGEIGESSTATTPTTSAPVSSSAPPMLAPRHRSTSVIQRIVLDEEGRPQGSPENGSLLQQVAKKGSTMAKAITIPAWQFFRLIPWHNTSSSAEPRNDAEVAAQFNQRPVVSICLKRYMMTRSGVPKRHNTYIDIPDSLALPQFMMPDAVKVEEDPSGFGREYKLVLQSVVCHRGDSLQSGHYIAFSRVAPRLLTENRRHAADPPPDYEEAQWVKFDDLQIDNRVSGVVDIKEALKAEMPYLLFYQIVPVVDATAADACLTDGEATGPPSYNESRTDVGSSLAAGKSVASLPHEPSTDYFDAASWTMVSAANKPPSIRLSVELDRPGRSSISGDEDGGGYMAPVHMDSRRASVTFTDSTFVSPAMTPEGGVSPALTPAESVSTGNGPAPQNPQNVQAQAQQEKRFSRTRDRFAKAGNRSRPASQAGEGRMSMSSTMTRLSGLMRTSKEPLKDGVQLPNGLVASATAPAVAGLAEPGAVEGEVAVVAAGEALAEGDVAAAAVAHRHRRGKSKSRADKDRNKKEGLPERECSVM